MQEAALKTISGNQRGGIRRGAGRKAGSATVRTREIADKAAAAGITPLEYLLELMRKPYPENADPAVLVAYDSMKLDAAKAAAPYIHPRLANRDNPVKLGKLAGSLADQGSAVLTALADGKLAPSEAGSVMGAIAAQARVVEVDELEKRVKALEEQQQNAKH
jgi:hypothetical protein